MLSPGFLENAPKRLVELYAEIEADIIADMAKRISAYGDFIPAAEYQYRKLIDMGGVHDQIIEKLSAASGIRRRELERLIQKAGTRAVKTTTGISSELKEVLRAGFDSTNGLFENLTHTTAAAGQQQFEHALDRAWMQINSGAFSYNDAIQTAVRDLSSKGLAAVVYPNKTEYIDVAVRRAVVTGVNQTALKVQEKLSAELETDLVEVTAHSGARVGEGVADHAGWQGKVYSLSGKHPKYPSLREVTGYGTGAGLGGWNCRHSFFPFFEGASEPAYTQEELDALNSPKYDYGGKKLTEYEATQVQRDIERNIRKYKREFKAAEAAGQPSGEAASKLRAWQDKQKDFIDKTGLKRQYARETVESFGDNEARKAAREAKALDFIQNDVIIKAKSELPKKIELPDERLKSTAEVSLEKLHGIVPKGSNLTDVYVMAGKGTSVPIRDLKRLYSVYGGDPADWQKKSGDAYGKDYRYVVHWYERKGFVPEEEVKLKGVKKR